MKNISILLLALFSFTISMTGQSNKLMTYNIRYDNVNDGENQWAKRKTFLCDQISFFEPDIFGIQEGLVHQVEYIDSVLTDYSYLGVGRDDGKRKGEYSAIFYNEIKFKVLDEGTFWLSETPEKISVGWDASMERICTYALFKEKKSKKEFWVFNTHFDHIGEIARKESVQLIIERVKGLNSDDRPVFIMGDFNLVPSSDPIKALSEVFEDSKSISIANPFGPEGTFSGFDFSKPLVDRIDYIFVSKGGITVKKYAVLSDSKDFKYPSDHLPVLIEVDIEKK